MFGLTCTKLTAMRNLASLIFCLALSPAALFSQGYEVSGKITGAEGATFLLQRNPQGRVVVFDTAIVQNGSFKFRGGSVAFPEMVTMFSPSLRKGFSFFIENSSITIAADMGSLADVRVTGSATHDEYMRFSKMREPYERKMKALMEEYQSKSRNISEEEKQQEIKYIKDNPRSYVSINIMQNYLRRPTGGLTPEEIESVIKSLDQEMLLSPEMSEIKAKLDVIIPLLPGRKAPDFTMNDVNGVPVALSSKLGKKLLLIDFWAGWCNPCRMENPNVLRTYNDFSGMGFDILGVSLDRTRDAWIKAIAEDKLPWTQVSDLKYFNCAAAKLYNVNAIPANFLLDEKGTIVASNLRGEALYNKVKELLGEK